MAKEKWKVSKGKTREVKRALRRLKMSLREISRDLYGGEIKYQMLGRFIAEKDYIPTERRVCELLGIVAKPNPYQGLPRWWKRTPEALKFRDRKREQIRGMFDEAKRQRVERVK